MDANKLSNGSPSLGASAYDGRAVAGADERRPLLETDIAPDLCITGAMNSFIAQGESPSGRKHAEAVGSERPVMSSAGPILERGGFDTVYLSVYGKWKSDAYIRMNREFDTARKAAEEGDAVGKILHVGEGDVMEMQPAGANKGVYYRWVLEWGGCRIYVMRMAQEHETIPSISLQVGSLVLMRLGIDVIWEAFQGLLALWGFEFNRECVSRVDLCADIPNVHVREFVKRWQQFKFITKGRGGATYFDRPGDYTGMTLGGCRVHFRVYDKIAECQDELKLEVLRQKRWGGVIPETATRVEFELHREVLRERWDISTLADLRAKLPALCEWLTGEWIRFTDVDVDRENNNQSKVETSPLWVEVQEAFASWAGKPSEPCSIPRRVIEPKTDKLFKQAAGCMKSAFAYLGQSCADPMEFLVQVYRKLKPYAPTFQPRVEQKRNELTAQGILCMDDGVFTDFENALADHQAAIIADFA